MDAGPAFEFYPGVELAGREAHNVDLWSASLEELKLACLLHPTCTGFTSAGSIYHDSEGPFLLQAEHVTDIGESSAEDTFAPRCSLGLWVKRPQVYWCSKRSASAGRGSDGAGAGLGGLGV